MYNLVIEQASEPPAEAFERLDDPASSSDEKFEACRQLISSGVLERAEAELSSLAAVSEISEKAQRLLTICRRLQRQAPSTHDELAAIERDPQTGCWWARPAGEGTTVVAFAGNGHRMGISVYFMLRILAGLRCNAVVVFDTSKRLYLRGVPGLGSSVEETASALRPIIDRMGGRRVICLGQSAGGFGAIRYASLIGAGSVMAFSPTVYPEPSQRRNRLRRLGLEDLPEIDIDLRAQRLAGPLPPHLHIVYGDLHGRDRASARSLADLPGVTTTALEGVADHPSLQTCVVAGTFVTMFESFLAEVQEAPARWRA